MKKAKEQRKSGTIQHSGRIPQSSQKLKQTFGICDRCLSSIEIPGLEAFKCSGGCGWVSRKSEKSTDLYRPVQVIRVDLAPVSKSQTSLLDLVGQGGEA